MTDKHFYYLHTNGDLIHKPTIVVENDSQYFDSPFVRKVWTLDKTDRGTGYILLIEAASLGANMKRVLELAEKWDMNGEDGLEFCARGGMVCEPVETEAGPGYNVHHKDDDENRSRGEGSTPLLALISYVRAGDWVKKSGA